MKKNNGVENSRNAGRDVSRTAYEALRGSYVAFAICGLSLALSLFIRLVPPIYFVPILGLWMIYAAYRLFALVAKVRHSQLTDDSARNSAVYWLAALGSCFLAPLVWAIVVALATSQVRSFP
jgi:hypothetical protein